MRHRQKEAEREVRRAKRREEAAIVERVKVMKASVEDLRNKISENTTKLQESQEELAKTDAKLSAAEKMHRAIKRRAVARWEDVCQRIEKEDAKVKSLDYTLRSHLYSCLE